MISRARRTGGLEAPPDQSRSTAIPSLLQCNAAGPAGRNVVDPRTAAHLRLGLDHGVARLLAAGAQRFNLSNEAARRIAGFVLDRSVVIERIVARCIGLVVADVAIDLTNPARRDQARRTALRTRSAWSASPRTAICTGS